MNLKRKRAAVKLRKSIYFSLYVTIATVSVGVGVSVPVFLKVRKELNNAIKAAASVNTDMLNLADELGLKDDDDIIRKIPGGYYLHYARGKAVVYVQDKQGNKETMFEIMPTGEIITKHVLTGNAAKTIVSIIAMIKQFLFTEMQAEMDILLPFVREIINKEIEAEIVTGARQVAQDKARPILGDNFAYQDDLDRWKELDKVENWKRTDDHKSEMKEIADKIRPDMTEGILAFYEGYYVNREEIITYAQKERDDLDNSSENLEEIYNDEHIMQIGKIGFLKDIFSSMSKSSLIDELKYTGWSFSDFLDYFQAARHGQKIIDKIRDNKRKKSEALLKEFEGDVTDENIFNKISADFGNTFVAFSKTYGFIDGNGKTIAQSESIRNKLSKYLKNLGLTEYNQNLMTKKIKEMIGYKDGDKNGKYILDSSASKQIKIGDKIYSLLTISSYESLEKKKNSEPFKTLNYVIEQKGQSDKLWHITIHNVESSILNQLIKLSNVMKFSEMEETSTSNRNLNILIDDLIGSNNIDEWKNISYIWDNISKPIIWKYFAKSLNDNEKSIYTSLKDYNSKFLSYAKTPDYYDGDEEDYVPYAADFIMQYDGNIEQFTFEFLETMNSKMYEGSQGVFYILDKDKRREKLGAFTKAITIAINDSGFNNVLSKIANYGVYQIETFLNEIDFNNLDESIRKLAGEFSEK